MSGIAGREKHGGRFDARKRRSGVDSSSNVDDINEGIEMTNLRELYDEKMAVLSALHSPMVSEVAGVYNMQKTGDRDRLAADIWTADFKVAMESLKAANPELVVVLEAMISNTTPLTEVSVAHKQRQLEGIMLNVVRAQSIHKVPILTAVLSIMCEANLVKREFHDAIAFMMKGALMSETWTHSFMKQASQQRPASNESMIPGVMVTCFDNLTMNVAYHAMSVAGVTGEKLDMTNWFAVLIPRSLAPTLDGARTCT